MAKTATFTSLLLFLLTTAFVGNAMAALDTDSLPTSTTPTISSTPEDIIETTLEHNESVFIATNAPDIMTIRMAALAEPPRD
jgi:hypothetical protein